MDKDYLDYLKEEYKNKVAELETIQAEIEDLRKQRTSAESEKTQVERKLKSKKITGKERKQLVSKKDKLEKEIERLNKKLRTNDERLKKCKAQIDKIDDDIYTYDEDYLKFENEELLKLQQQLEANPQDKSLSKKIKKLEESIEKKEKERQRVMRNAQNYLKRQNDPKRKVKAPKVNSKKTYKNKKMTKEENILANFDADILKGILAELTDRLNQLSDGKEKDDLRQKIESICENFEEKLGLNDAKKDTKVNKPYAVFVNNGIINIIGNLTKKEVMELSSDIIDNYRNNNTEFKVVLHNGLKEGKNIIRSIGLDIYLDKDGNMLLDNDTYDVEYHNNDVSKALESKKALETPFRVLTPTENVKDTEEKVGPEFEKTTTIDDLEEPVYDMSGLDVEPKAVSNPIKDSTVIPKVDEDDLSKGAEGFVRGGIPENAKKVKNRHRDVALVDKISSRWKVAVTAAAVIATTLFGVGMCSMTNNNTLDNPENNNSSISYNDVNGSDVNADLTNTNNDYSGANLDTNNLDVNVDQTANNVDLATIEAAVKAALPMEGEPVYSNAWDAVNHTNPQTANEWFTGSTPKELYNTVTGQRMSVSLDQLKDQNFINSLNNTGEWSLVLGDDNDLNGWISLDDFLNKVQDNLQEQIEQGGKTK